MIHKSCSTIMLGQDSTKAETCGDVRSGDVSSSLDTPKLKLGCVRSLLFSPRMLPVRRPSVEADLSKYETSTSPLFLSVAT